MARSKKKSDSTETFLSTFQHGSSKRLNIPEATETQSGLSKGKKQQYAYNPHLSPVLRFDESGLWDKLTKLVEKVKIGVRLSADELELLRAVCEQGANPWFEWAGKQEQHVRGSFSVDDVVLHIHERISAQAIISAAKREQVSEQDLFARPKLHQEQALQYYRHSMDWANRLILGDSLQVMSSLARREGLAGQVQMVYMDPPYGIKYSSNWQNELGKRDVKEKDEDVSREPEMIRAYRDTWTLGVHSYLTYLKQRLLVSRELLKDSGSVFVQISDENLHRVRAVMDEVFGAANFCSIISFQKTGSMAANLLPTTVDYIIWYAKDRPKAKYRQLYAARKAGDPSLDRYDQVRLPNGASGPLRDGELPPGAKRFQLTSLFSDGASSTPQSFLFRENTYEPKGNAHWKTNVVGLERLARAERIEPQGDRLRYVRYAEDFNLIPISDRWESVQIGKEALYVVQTATAVIERCLLMTTDPGDLVVDPTCGSGSTAYVAEEWGRRWVTIDSSRIATAIARQRLLTACYEAFKTKDPSSGIDASAPQNPSFGFYYKRVPHVSLKDIAQNKALDAVIAKHEPILQEKLGKLNHTLDSALSDTNLTQKLVQKLAAKVSADGAREISDADLRRWLLPTTERALINFGTASQRKAWGDSIPKGKHWKEWEVPFDSDEDWSGTLSDAVNEYRVAWKAKNNDVNRAVEQNADQEELVDQPEIVRGVSRVAGPFTVEGVRPEELALGEDGKVYDPTTNAGDEVSSANADSYLDLMIGLIRKDGVTFLGNRRAEFDSLVKEAGRGFHARGRWINKSDDLDNVAVFFGPQYGPVNAPMMREAIESAHGLKEVDELVVAGFSFDSAAQEVAKEKDSEKLRVHLAHIRPDVSPGMQGLLKETANSQLFTVFGQPDIAVVDAEDGMKQVRMSGVCVYNPLTGEITEAQANKVSAWFLDTDYDGRCFCISQAFFPDKEAWAKIAKALGSSVGAGVFEDSTVSWPFKVGKHKRIAVKVIDPRGNEVMAIKTLNA